MQINSDLSKRAAVEGDKLDWVATRLPGVERRMLERDGAESGRATTIVRYAPGSSFSPHTHTGGEEFVVLEGTFSDDMGDFPKGMYVRNPVGSTHTPSSADGCVILVKLWQIPPEDQEFVRVDINDAENWQPGRCGEQVLALHETEDEVVQMLRWSPGALFEAREYPDGAEFFVIEGSFTDDHGTYPKHSWLRLPPGAKHTPKSEEGCLIYVKTGHLSGAVEKLFK